MTKKVLSLQPSDSFEKGLEVLSNKKIRHIPVLKGNEIIGMVSQGDLVKEMISHQQDLISQLESFIQN